MSPPFDPSSFLRSLPLLLGWAGRETALADLASRAEVWAFLEGAFIRFPDEGPAGIVWVVEGCLETWESGRGSAFVGVRERLEVPLGVTVKGKTPGRFVKISQNSWRAWLLRWPKAAEILQEPVPSALPRTLAKSPWLLEPDEVPVHIFRKSGSVATQIV